MLETVVVEQIGPLEDVFEGQEYNGLWSKIVGIKFSRSDIFSLSKKIGKSVGKGGKEDTTYLKKITQDAICTI